MTVGKGARTRASIVEIGLQVWRETPEKVNANHIASLVGITHGACLYHFKTVDLLRDAIAQHAVRTGDKIVVPMLLAARHPATAELTTEQKAEYLSNL